MTSNSAESEYGNGDSGQSKPRYTLRPVVKPLPSQVAAAKSVAADKAMPAGVRAECEDDDGYDPYSDYHDGNAARLEFEENPWS